MLLSSCCDKSKCVLCNQSGPANGCSAVIAGTQPSLIMLLVPPVRRLIRAHNTTILAETLQHICGSHLDSAIHSRVAPGAVDLGQHRQSASSRVCRVWCGVGTESGFEGHPLLTAIGLSTTPLSARAARAHVHFTGRQLCTRKWQSGDSLQWMNNVKHGCSRSYLELIVHRRQRNTAKCSAAMYLLY